MLRSKILVVHFAIWVFSDPFYDCSVDSVYRGFTWLVIGRVDSKRCIKEVHSFQYRS